MKTREEAIKHIEKTWEEFVKDGKFYGMYQSHYEMAHKRTPNQLYIEYCRSRGFSLELDENGQETVPEGPLMAGGAVIINFTELLGIENARNRVKEQVIEYEMKREKSEYETEELNVVQRTTTP